MEGDCYQGKWRTTNHIKGNLKVERVITEQENVAMKWEIKNREGIDTGARVRIQNNNEISNRYRGSDKDGKEL